jgi:hypothetical protein
MTQEDKELLIKDLCPRLPYGVYVEHINTGMRGHLHDLKVYPLYDKTDDHIYDYICSTDFLGDGDYFDIEAFKPLLFPLSSMTEEQKEELRLEHEKDVKTMANCLKKCSEGDTSLRGKNILYHSVDWCNKHHFDYRRLIEKGLAIDATGKNIY